MYSTSSSSKNKSHRNVCRIDLNDGSGASNSSSRLSNSYLDKSRYANNSTVNQRPSTSSPMNQNAPLKNYSSFQNLISQLQPSTSKSSKNYSQNKQLLICKKNEIIKTALKNSLTIKKPSASAKTEHRETGPVKPYAKFEKENELPPDARIKSREKMDQFYSNMKYGRAQSTLKQGGAERNEGIASYVSPKNRSFVQKAVVPNGTVNLSRLSGAHEPRTTNTTMIKYVSDPQDPSTSSRKDRGKSFDYKQDMSNAAKFHMQNRILLDLDESMNMGPIENIPVKGASTTAHARYSQSKDEIRNVMTPGNYHGSKQRSGSNTRPPKIDFPCKIVREQEKPFQNPKESSPEKEDIFEFENISPIKTNHNRGSSAHNFSSNTIKEGLERAQRNLANQPYPTIIKQINLNSNTPTSGAKPPLYNFPQQGDDVSTPLTTQENEKRYIQDYVKQKSLNIQTVKENKKIEFPGYLQNLTYDRSNPTKNIAFHTTDHRRAETPNERSYKAPLQPATINFIESLKRNRLSERLPDDHSREYGLNKPSMVTDTNRYTADGGRESYGGRYNYDDVVAAAAQKRAEMSNRSTAKTPKNGSLVENFVKQLLENAKAEKMPSSENIVPSSVKGTFVHPDKYFIDVAEILPKKEKTPQHNIQTPPVLFSNKNQAPEEKESVPRKPSVQNDINILGIDPAEKEFKMKKFKEDYIIGKQIGQGAYAVVRIGVHKPTNTKVAIKIYEKVKIMDPMRSRSVKREIKLMQRIDHQSIIKIYDVVETNNHMNIIMEYIGGTSLHSFLKAQPNRRLKEEHAFNIFKQVVNGLYYCHGRCIAHRDIKLENMLLDSYGNLKIIDFGFSTCIPNDKKVRMFCGTPSYMAPEIVTKAEYCGPPADVWALGVLLYALLCGTFPFKGMDDKDLYAKISKGDFVIPEFVSDHAQSLLRKMMTVDPDKRPSAKEVMSDPWYVMHAFMDKKTDRRISSRSSSSLDRSRLEKPDSKPNFPSNLNIVQPVGEQQYTQIANFIKSPQNQFQRDEYAKVDIRNIRRKDDDHPRDQVRHLSLNNSRYTGGGKQNTTYGNIRNISNINDGDTLVYEDNADENKYSFKKTLTENEVWNIPANISSEKSFQPAFGGRGSQMSAFQNKSLKRNEETGGQVQGQGQYDPEIINNLTKMGYKDEEINTGLKEKTGAVYYIYNRMVNERKTALHNSGFVDSITSDQNTNNNNNSFNLSSHMALKRKSVNMAVSKNPQEKENIYNALPPKTGSTKEEMGASEM